MLHSQPTEIYPVLIDLQAIERSKGKGENDSCAIQIDAPGLYLYYQIHIRLSSIDVGKYKIKSLH
jgi:hypothetical protein